MVVEVRYGYRGATLCGENYYYCTTTVVVQVAAVLGGRV